MDEAIALEERIQSCYGLLSKLSADGLAHEFRELAREEKSHVNVLRTGKSFVIRAPEVFAGEMVLGEEIRSGIKAACDLEAGLKAQKLEFAKALKRIHDLERKCERIHLDTALEFKDYSLKKLFEILARADAEHRQRLERLIAEL
jgi:hypothetical protein